MAHHPNISHLRASQALTLFQAALGTALFNLTWIITHDIPRTDAANTLEHLRDTPMTLPSATVLGGLSLLMLALPGLPRTGSITPGERLLRSTLTAAMLAFSWHLNQITIDAKFSIPLLNPWAGTFLAGLIAVRLVIIFTDKRQSLSRLVALREPLQRLSRELPGWKHVRHQNWPETARHLISPEQRHYTLHLAQAMERREHGESFATWLGPSVERIENRQWSGTSVLWPVLRYAEGFYHPTPWQSGLGLTLVATPERLSDYLTAKPKPKRPEGEYTQVEFTPPEPETAPEVSEAPRAAETKVNIPPLNPMHTVNIRQRGQKVRTQALSALVKSAQGHNLMFEETPAGLIIIHHRHSRWVLGVWPHPEVPISSHPDHRLFEYLINEMQQPRSLLWTPLIGDIAPLRMLMPDHTVIFNAQAHDLVNHITSPKNRTVSDILGVDEQASISEIKAAYRKLTLTYHPDKVQRLSPADQAAASETMKEINAAYKELLNRRT